MKDNYVIKVQGRLVIVTEEVYMSYYKMERHERWLIEKDTKHGVVSFQALDTDNWLGEEVIEDKGMAVCELVETKLLIEKLEKCLAELNENEVQLINYIFYQNKPEREVAALFGCSPSTLHDRKMKILAKLKSMLV